MSNNGLPVTDVVGVSVSLGQRRTAGASAGDAYAEAAQGSAILAAGSAAQAKQAAEYAGEVSGDVAENAEKATDAATRAESAAESAQNVADANTYYTTPEDPDGTIAGLAGTPNGKSFRVGLGPNGGFKYYINNNGVALQIAYFTGKESFDELMLMIIDIAARTNPIQTTDDALFDFVTANGVRPFMLREEDGAAVFDMIAKLVTGDDGLKFGNSFIDNAAPDGWVWLHHSANGAIIAGVRDDGTTVGLGGGSSGPSGAIIPGDTAVSYDDIRNYTGDATVRDVVGNRVGGRFVVFDGSTDEDDAGGVLVGVDGRRWIRQAASVSYDMFGAPRIPEDVYQRYVALSKEGEETAAQALLEGLEAADAAIARCHAFANKYGLSVVQNVGRFLWVGQEFNVRTYTRLTGCTLVTCNRSGTAEARWGTVDGVDDGAPEPMYIYRITGKDKIRLTADELADLNTNYAGYFAKGSMQLPYPKLKAYRGGMLTVISSAVELYRSGVRANPRYEVHQRDFSRIGRNGALSDVLVKNIPAGTINEAIITPKEDAWLTFEPPHFFEAGNGRKYVNIQIERPQVEIKNLVMDNYSTGDVQSRVAVGSYAVFDIRLNNLTGECIPSEAGGGYIICCRNSIEVHASGLYGLNGWGFQGHHGVKRMFITRSVLNRFDFHSFGYDVYLDNIKMKGRQIYLQGGGQFKISNFDYEVTKYQIKASETLEYRLSYMVNMREDYAGDCECNLIIQDGVIRFDRNINVAWSADNLTFDIVRLNSGESVNYGIDTKTPHTIFGENIVFDFEGSPESLPDNFAFTFCRAYRSRYSTSNLTFLPDVISVRNMTAINVPVDKNAFMAVFRTDAELAGNPKGSRNKLRPDGTNARIMGENLQSVVNNPVVASNACPTVYLPGDTSKWDATVNGTTYRTSANAWVPKVTLINCDPIIINATGARAVFDIHGGLLARFTAGETGNRCRVTGADIQLYPDAAGVTYFDADNVRTANCDWLDPANGAIYAGTLKGIGNENRGTPEHSPNI
ncbi:hypothetical protein [Serratia ficaria]|uniref:hypothetical protein n=1 Tax=Serratia ficaria TaxID=61651 RepID=UPI0021B7E71F|nr:hypothetical protein [Serratia ficaria]